MDAAQSAAGTSRDERYMTAREEMEVRAAELQQRWHGWGSPVGLGIAMLSTGGFVLLLAAAWKLVA